MVHLCKLFSNGSAKWLLSTFILTLELTPPMYMGESICSKYQFVNTCMYCVYKLTT